MSIALRRRKLRPPLDLEDHVQRAARRLEHAGGAVERHATLMTSAVTAVPLCCSALRSELSSGTSTECGTTSRR